jgi:hypothetical protein
MDVDIDSASMFYTTILYELRVQHPAGTTPTIFANADGPTNHCAVLAMFCATVPTLMFVYTLLSRLFDKLVSLSLSARIENLTTEISLIISRLL